MTEMTANGRQIPARSSGRRSFYDKEVQGIIWQVATIVIVVGIGWYLYHNMLVNLERLQIQTGWDFLTRASSFDIGESMIEYSSASPYWKALLAGIINTFRIAIVGCIVATFIGVFIGVSSLSRNLLVNKITSGYIHLLRNIPVLLQMIFWYAIFHSPELFPHPRQAESVLSFYATQRGFYMPVPSEHIGWTLAFIGLVAGIVAAVFVGRWAKQRHAQTGQAFPTFLATLGLMFGLAFVGWLIGGAPTVMDVPALRGFNIQGGWSLSPEFMAVLTGLTLYTSAFIGEIVRSGILSVPKGQIEAARAVGLRESVIMRKIILPQALRVIIPPQTSQYLNLTKNSSLSVAIGYPDFVSTANTTINQTGQAPEVIIIVMVIYLSISLTISLFMNWYNKQIQLVER